MRTKKSDLVAPTVNINGTMGLDLYQQQVNAVLALQEAAAVLKFTMPHGRDYLKPEELDLAVAQHGYWMSLLATILKELTEVAEATREQVKK